MSPPSLTEQLGRLAAETPAAAIPEPVRDRARISLLHNLVIGAAGRPRETVAARTAQRFYAHPPEATLLHNAARVSAEGAALANAALMNIRSQDDTHAGSTTHPGSPTIAAALAIAESNGNTGAETLTAIILGYEILCRAGRDFDERFTSRGFRAASLAAGFGAAAAAARLLGLNAAQCAHAFGLQANLAGGLSQVWREGSAEAPLQIGYAARNGIAAARAAACGAAAARFALDGEAGFHATFAGTREPASEALSGLGTNWQLLEITVKPLPVCAILQGPAMLFLDLARTRAIPPAAIESIELALNPYEADYPGIDHPGPFASAVATKLSAQFSLALAAIDARITPDGLSRVTDDAILTLSRTVRVIRDPTITPRLCRLEIRQRDGTTHSGMIDTPIGQPSFAECAAFARTLAPEIGASDAAMQRLITAVANLKAAPNVAELMEAASTL
jgi:2-methylcitrate dehydratase PrpD